jgi:uncharacterized membrane protein YciS (DUF1049 family)
MLRWFLIAVLVLALSLFVGYNKDGTGIVSYGFGDTGETSILVLLLIAFAVGFMTWFLISMFNFYKLKSELSAKEKLVENLKQELNSYRNQALTLDDGVKPEGK